MQMKLHVYVLSVLANAQDRKILTNIYLIAGDKYILSF